MERRIKMHDLNLGLAKEPFGIVKDRDTIRAEARAEALKEAADRAAEWYQMMYGKSWTQVVSELRAAITQDSKPCD
jgi:hypothetical protein